MRTRVIAAVGIVAAVAAVGTVLLLRGGSGGSRAAGSTGSTGTSSAGAGSGLRVRTIAAGAVEVTITPVRLDSSGAVFQVRLTTHSGDLGVDMARAARLEVDGVAWRDGSWTGDGAGGHHRAGELRFSAAGPARGSVRLTIDGLPAPVVAAWTVPSAGKP